MKKHVFLWLVLAALVAGGVFAQDSIIVNEATTMAVWGVYICV